MDAGKEAHPGKTSLEDGGLGAGDGLHSGAFQESFSGGFSPRTSPQRPGKGAPCITSMSVSSAGRLSTGSGTSCAASGVTGARSPTSATRVGKPSAGAAR